ncbi:MAG TPA: hypothetical protein VF765_17300 [Polyangiaceae bacterium]
MPKKDRFPHEADTAPGTKKPGTSGPAPKRRHSQSAPTLPPPPPSSRRKPPTARPTVRTPAVRTKSTPKNSSIKKRKPHESDIPGATIDEVVADLSRDPRREKD